MSQSTADGNLSPSPETDKHIGTGGYTGWAQQFEDLDHGRWRKPIPQDLSIAVNRIAYVVFGRGLRTSDVGRYHAGMMRGAEMYADRTPLLEPYG